MFTLTGVFPADFPVIHPMSARACGCTRCLHSGAALTVERACAGCLPFVDGSRPATAGTARTATAGLRGVRDAVRESRSSPFRTFRECGGIKSDAFRSSGAGDSVSDRAIRVSFPWEEGWMSDPITMHWVITHRSEAQIRAEEESMGRAAAALSRQVRRLNHRICQVFRRS